MKGKLNRRTVINKLMKQNPQTKAPKNNLIFRGDGFVTRKYGEGQKKSFSLAGNILMH
jgi:hypothetical protein